MNVRLIPAEQLTAEHVAAWDAIQRAEAALDSPYFRPEFIQAVAAVRGGVEVGVLEDHGTPVGFFPFQRGRGNVAQPVGGRMSDFHGVVVAAGTAWNPWQLLRGCGLAAWHFNHLIAGQEPLRPYHWNVAPSPYLDLSGGWDGYQARQLAAHRKSFQRAMGKLRHAQRLAGPLRVEIHSDKRSVFRALMKWKAQQYQRKRTIQRPAHDWKVALLERVLAARGEAFSGLLSAFYLNDVLAAVLLSMRSYGVAHAWFAAYRPKFAPLSPGLILWLELARLYPQLGIRRLDMGKGPEPYKTHLMSGTADVAEGSVDFRPVMRVRAAELVLGA